MRRLSQLLLYCLLTAPCLPAGAAHAHEDHHDVYATLSRAWWVEDRPYGSATMVLLHYQWMRRLSSSPLLAGLRFGIGTWVSGGVAPWSQAEFALSLRPQVEPRHTTLLAELGLGLESILFILTPAFPTLGADLGLLMPIGAGHASLDLRIRGRMTSLNGAGLIWSEVLCVGVTFTRPK